jgi:hypothetical protein
MITVNYPKDPFTSVYDMIGLLIRSKQIPMIIDELKIYINFFETKYHVEFSFFARKTPKKVISLKEVSLKGNTSMFGDGYTNQLEMHGYEPSETVECFCLNTCCKTRKRSCGVLLLPDRDALINVLKFFIKGKHLEFTYHRNQIEVSFDCTENITMLKRIKQAATTVATTVVAAAAAATEEQKTDVHCENKIKITHNSIGNAVRFFKKGKPFEFTKQELEQLKLFYIEILQAHSKTAFPGHQIVFCKNIDCQDALGFVIPSHEKNAQCPTCMDVFCVTCNVKGLHKMDGSDCSEVLRAHREEVSALSDIKICPECTTRISRTEGCNKMSCKCGTTFCYICEQKTALQSSDLQMIKNHFIQEGRPIKFTTGESRFLYFHNDSMCPVVSLGDGAFRGLFEIPTVIQEIKYRDDTPLSLEDSETILEMIDLAIQQNHP